MTEQQMTAFEAFLKRELPNHSIEEIALGTLNLARNAWAAALSHAEGEAVGVVEPADHQTPAAWLGDKPRRMVVTETSSGSIQALPEGTKLYTHPAPHVACQTCGGSGLLGERPTHQNPDDAHCEPCPDCSDAAPQVAVPEDRK